MSRIERIGDATLYLGDCRDILPELGDCSSVLSDVPYGIDYASGWATDALWAGGRSIANDGDTLARDGALAVLPADLPKLIFGSRKVPPPAGCRQVLIWDKGPALGMGDLSIPWKPSWEEIYVLGKGFIGDRDEGSVIYCPPVQSMAKNGRLHPNEKPVALLRRLLRKLPGRLVLDPFMGSGSTGVACAARGYGFVGVEISEPYFDIACRRIEEAYRQPRLFDEPAPKPQQGSIFDGEAA